MTTDFSVINGGSQFAPLAARLMQRCEAQHIYIATAESLTGGLLADAFVSVSGASSVFLGSVVTYNINSKQLLLGVNQTILHNQGAVTSEVASQMSYGVAKKFKPIVKNSLVLGLSTTGVAGPQSDGFKPVGTVYDSAYLTDSNSQVHLRNFQGDRVTIREQAVEDVLNLGLKLLDNNK